MVSTLLKHFDGIKHYLNHHNLFFIFTQKDIKNNLNSKENRT